MVDENGDGVLSITKTPFEITMKMQDPETKYVAVMLDANGDILPDGGVANGNAGTYAIQDRDISTVYIYLCFFFVVIGPVVAFQLIHILIVTLFSRKAVFKTL